MPPRTIRRAKPNPELTEAQAADLTNVPLVIGVPFALEHDCHLPDEDAEAGIPGSFASVECKTDGCSETFLIDLLEEAEKRCPGCGTGYSHALLVCRSDNNEIVEDFVREVAKANGARLPDEDGDDSDDDDSDDDDSDDDDSDDDDDDDDQEQTAT